MRVRLRRHREAEAAPPWRVAVVTDSTAMLPAEVVAAHGVTVIPLQVVVDGTGYDEGTPQATPAAVAEALTAKKAVSTSRVAPATFAAAYTGLALQGYEEIVSVHLAGPLSGTVDAARQAAKTVMLPVTVVDTGTAGPALGRAVLVAVGVVETGGSAEDAGAAASRLTSETRSYFYVDTLEYLRRGGRIGTATALLGSALAVKPLLTIEAGRVVLHERVRTAARAIARLEDLAVETATAAGGPVAVSVAHFGSPDRAAELAASLRGRLPQTGGVSMAHAPRDDVPASDVPAADTPIAELSAADVPGAHVPVAEVSSVLGAHLGPGMLAVVIGPAS